MVAKSATAGAAARARARTQTKYLQSVAAHGQAFSYRYLSPEARRQYWVHVVREYRQLFGPDLDAFIAQQVTRFSLAGVSWYLCETRQPSVSLCNCRGTCIPV